MPSTSDADIISKVIAQIPFESIYSYGDTLFDIKVNRDNPLVFEDSRLQTEVEFLRGTRLKDMEFLNVMDENFFTIRNVRTGDECRFSNRASIGELRGEVLQGKTSGERVYSERRDRL